MSHRSQLDLSVWAAAALLAAAAAPAYAAPAPCTPKVTVTGSLGGQVYGRVYDHNESTYVASPPEGWHYVQLDFACEVEVQALRRYVGRPGQPPGSLRTGLGEGVAYSQDGVHWRDLGPGNSAGWPTGGATQAAGSAKAAADDGDEGPDELTPYPGFAWRSLAYGWSSWLHPQAGVRARYVRYTWQAITGERIHEVEVTYAHARTALGWDWTAWDWSQGGFLDVRYDGDMRNPRQMVDLPWNDLHGTCRQETPDVLPENGWVLVKGDFGANLVPPLPDLPYFLLYNKYRGLLRGYFFYGARTGFVHMATHQMGNLAIENAPMPAFAHLTGKILDDFEPDYEQVFIKKDLELDHWACLEFDVIGYDPDAATKTAAAFNMHLRGLEVAVVDAEVIEHLRGALEAGNVRTGMDGGVWDSISRGGDSFLNAVEIYNSVSDLVDDLEEKGNDNPATWWGPILSGAAGLATGGDVPLIAAAAGFLTSLFSGGDGPQVPLSWAVDLTGDFKINGTIQTSPDLAAMRVYVPGTPPGRDPRLNPFYTEPLGIYALTARPVLDWWSWPHNWRGVNVTMDTNSIIVNPSSGLRLRSVKTAIVWRGAEPKRFVVPAVIPTLPRIRMTQAELAAAKVGLLLEFERIDRPDLDPIVLYREYEAERVNNGVEDPDGGPQP